MSKKTPLLVSFSGGRTSAFMSKWLIDHKSSEYDLHFVFANTGLEHEKTLEFVDRCDREWGLNLTWIESVTHRMKGKANTHRVVDFASASIDGEPFYDMVAWYGLPGPGWNHCNRELKLNAMLDWERTQGFENAKWAVGIRVDEIDRMSPTAEKRRVVYPLISWRPTTKPEIRHWWRDQPFDLNLSEHMGNCVTCWKKSDRKLYTVAKHEPIRFVHFSAMEQAHCTTGEGIDKTEHGRRFFFRKHRTTADILDASRQPFKEFHDYMPEWQQDFMGMDQSSGCSDSCDVFSE